MLGGVQASAQIPFWAVRWALDYRLAVNQTLNGQPPAM